ncbi:MAG: leucine-rich repeat domain-containing protein [Bacteroidales bacterium]|nr:leucine-rich repeat domain-containing protein [Bacteroidales bacterium]
MDSKQDAHVSVIYTPTRVDYIYIWRGLLFIIFRWAVQSLKLIIDNSSHALFYIIRTHPGIVRARKIYFMKKIYFKQFIVAIIALLCCVSATARKIDVDGIYYNILSEDERTVEVTSGPSRKPYTFTEFTIPETVVFDSVTYRVVGIGKQAFNRSKNLTELIIPNSIISIGDAAFQNCTLLASITLGENISTVSATAFNTCSALEKVTFNTKVLGGWFSGNKYIKEVIIGDSVRSIAGAAFQGCDSLYSIVVKEGNAVFDSRNNCNAVVETATNAIVAGCAETVIPESVATIKNGAFYGCTALTNITIPQNVTDIENSTFNGCTNLEKVTLNTDSIGQWFSRNPSIKEVIIGEGVTSIGAHAFNGCAALVNISIPSSIIKVGGAAFLGTAWYDNLPDGVVYIGKLLYCYKGVMPEGTTINVKEGTTIINNGVFSDFYVSNALVGITLPNSLTTIDEYAFYDCRNLKKISIPNSVTFIGRAAFGNCESLDSVTISENIKNIDYETFYGCKSLTSITIPKGVETIGKNSFMNCSALKNLTISEGVATIGNQAFSNCSALASVAIPNSVKIIESGAFNGCTALTNVTIGENVDSIYTGAFGSCSSLKSVKIPCGVKFVAGGAFGGCDSLASIVVDVANSVYDSRNNCNAIIETATNTLVQACNTTIIPEGVTAIGSVAFNALSIKEIKIPGSVTKIEDYAFNICPALEKIVIPASVTSIGANPFLYCDNLKSIVIEEGNPVYDSRNACNAIIETATNTLVQGCINTVIPEGIATIGEGAFANLTFTNIAIPESVTSIGSRAFAYCYNLTNVSLPENLTTIGNSAFSGCSSLTNVVIPDKVTIIGAHAFESCTAVEKITIGKSVQSIGDYAFRFCKNLKGVSVPKSVTTIGGEALYGCSSLNWFSIEDGTTPLTIKSEYHTDAFFEGCPLESMYMGRTIKLFKIRNIIDEYRYNNRLTTLTIGKNVTSLENVLFNYCNYLKSVYMLNPAPFAINDYTFSSATLYVPYGSLDAYKADRNWLVSFKQIVEFDATGVDEVEEDAPAFEVTAGGVQFTDAEGKIVTVYTAAGALVEKINNYMGEEISIDKGVYILCVGDKVVKVKL